MAFYYFSFDRNTDETDLAGSSRIFLFLVLFPVLISPIVSTVNFGGVPNG